MRGQRLTRAPTLCTVIGLTSLEGRGGRGAGKGKQNKCKEAKEGDVKRTHKTKKSRKTAAVGRERKINGRSKRNEQLRAIIKT